MTYIVQLEFEKITAARIAGMAKWYGPPEYHGPQYESTWYSTSPMSHLSKKTSRFNHTISCDSLLKNYFVCVCVVRSTTTLGYCTTVVHTPYVHDPINCEVRHTVPVLYIPGSHYLYYYWVLLCGTVVCVNLVHTSHFTLHTVELLVP